MRGSRELRHSPCSPPAPRGCVCECVWVCVFITCGCKNPRAWFINGKKTISILSPANGLLRCGSKGLSLRGVCRAPSRGGGCSGLGASTGIRMSWWAPALRAGGERPLSSSRGVLIPLWRGRKRVQASLWSGKYTKCKLGKCACNRTFAMLYQIHSTTRCHPQHVKCNRWLLFIIWRVHVQHLLSMVTWPLLVKWGCATYGINQAASCFGRV